MGEDVIGVYMHIAVFILVNLLVASAIGVLAYLDGQGAWGIIWRVGATLIALQAAYALWLAAVVRFSRDKDGHATALDDRPDSAVPRQKLNHAPRN